MSERKLFKLADPFNVRIVKSGQAYTTVDVKDAEKLVAPTNYVIEDTQIGRITYIAEGTDTHYNLLYLFVPSNYELGVWVNETAFVREPDTPKSVPSSKKLDALCKNKYDVVLIGKYGTGAIIADVYTVLNGFKVTIAQLQHSIKKELKVGQRGHKDIEQDLIDIRDSTQSALDAYYAQRDLI